MKKVFTLLVILITLQLKASHDRYRLILRDDPSTSITVAWNQRSGSNPKVYYGTTDQGRDYNRYSDSKSPDRSTNYKGMKNTFARLTGLKPNTAYYFVIRDSNETSQRFWFKTAPADDTRLSFIAGGDSRNNRTPRRNANLLVSKLKPNAVLFGGDMTDDNTERQWKDWLDDWQLTIASDGRMFPIIPARGNHESSNSIYEIFDTRSRDAYYAMTFGDNMLRTYTLNTEISVSGNQTTWLRNDLNQNTNTTWKLAQYHKPMRPHVSSKSEGNSEYNSWAQLFYDKGVKLVIESDSHTVKTTWPVRPSTRSGSDEGFIRDDQNGTVYVGEGCWGAPLRSDNDQKDWTRNSSRFNQFKWFFVDKNKIEIRTVKVDNASQVGAVSNSNVFSMPSNIDLWKPSNGTVVVIEKETNNDPDDDPDTDATDGSLDIAISNGDDDVEEDKNGAIYASSSDLELVYDSYNNSSYQVVGLRYQGVKLPKNATIKTAYIQFTAKSSNSTATELEIGLQNIGNAPAFSNANNASSRAIFTNDKVIWKPASWTAGQRGSAQQTPDLKSMIQRLVDTNDWNSGNSLSFIIRGRGNSLTNTSAKRVPYSYNGGVSSAPRLIVEYGTNDSDDNDDPDDDPDSDPDDDSDPISASITVALRDGGDDVEENERGDLYTNSSDIEMVYDGHNSNGNQVIGLRFRRVRLPENATVTNAYIQFTADESHSASTELEISLHNSVSSPVFSNSNKVSNRPVFSTKVIWKPQAWIAGRRGNEQQTPNLKDMVQQLINKQGWSSGNDVSFIVRGKGTSLTSTSAKRVADSYESGAQNAATLIVEFTTPAKANSTGAIYKEGVVNRKAFETFPNPFESALNIKTPISEATNYIVTIYSLSGRIIYEEKVYVNSQESIIRLMPNIEQSGVYMLSLRNKKGKIIDTKRLLKK